MKKHLALAFMMALGMAIAQEPTSATKEESKGLNGPAQEQYNERIENDNV